MEGNAVPGVYAVGWIKRGPTGILGTNKRDAEETVDRLAEDLASGALKARGLPAREEIGSLIGERKPDVVTADGWHAIDARELQLGEDAQRPRVKLASRDELLAAGSK
jgi:ferredoxin--NADP+ reductase